jgi:hypothetical protein
MGNVLYRMSYSSIIRESQDLGAGLFDRDYNTLCESDLLADDRVTGPAIVIQHNSTTLVPPH